MGPLFLGAFSKDLVRDDEFAIQLFEQEFNRLSLCLLKLLQVREGSLRNLLLLLRILVYDWLEDILLRLRWFGQNSLRARLESPFWFTVLPHHRRLWYRVHRLVWLLISLLNRLSNKGLSILLLEPELLLPACIQVWRRRSLKLTLVLGLLIGLLLRCTIEVCMCLSSENVLLQILSLLILDYLLEITVWWSRLCKV